MTRSLALVALALLAACQGARRPGLSTAPCRWPSAPVVLSEAADTVILAWTYRAAALPAEPRPADVPALTAFRDSVLARTGTLDPLPHLDRQIGYYAGRPDSASQGEAANGRMVRDGVVGTLRPISCEEALLVEYQAARFPMVSRPTEFQAVRLERGAGPEGEVRIYFAGSGAPWPPKAQLLFERVAADRAAGWRAVAHLHNHPFLFSSAGDVAGANAPSLTDVQFWQHLRESIGIESARVTNGVTTFEAPAASFPELRSR